MFQIPSHNLQYIFQMENIGIWTSLFSRIVALWFSFLTHFELSQSNIGSKSYDKKTDNCLVVILFLLTPHSREKQNASLDSPIFFLDK